MTNNGNANREQVLGEFQQVLNSHGYGFQYSVLNLAKKLREEYKSEWRFEVAEFPVEVQGRGTRIDFVLSYAHGPLYIIAECKRANPALSNWCFVRAPFIRGDSAFRGLVIEQAKLETNQIYTSFKRKDVANYEPYHIALEVKANKLGDRTGGRPEAIEEAATQVCRGLNGMVETLAKHTQLIRNYRDKEYINLLPVIFTTAQIWASDIDLGSADLLTGEVDLVNAGFSPKEWILYQYHLSPGLKHSSSSIGPATSLGEIMEREYIRTIPIVSASGIESFLKWSGSQYLDR